MNVREDPQPPAVGDDSALLGWTLHAFRPRQVELTTTPLAGSAPKQEPTAKGPVGHDPDGLP